MYKFQLATIVLSAVCAFSHPIVDTPSDIDTNENVRMKREFGSTQWQYNPRFILKDGEFGHAKFVNARCTQDADDNDTSGTYRVSDGIMPHSGGEWPTVTFFTNKKNGATGNIGDCYFDVEYDGQRAGTCKMQVHIPFVGANYNQLDCYDGLKVADGTSAPPNESPWTGDVYITRA